MAKYPCMTSHHKFITLFSGSYAGPRVLAHKHRNRKTRGMALYIARPMHDSIVYKATHPRFSVLMLANECVEIRGGEFPAVYPWLGETCRPETPQLGCGPVTLPQTLIGWTGSK